VQTVEQLEEMGQMTQGPVFPSSSSSGYGSFKTTVVDPKLKLGKDEVELLEAEFQRNAKPSSGRKREIAKQLRVDHPRINVGP